MHTTAARTEIVSQLPKGGWSRQEAGLPKGGW